MKINLTRLLELPNRVHKLNDDKGSTGDTTYIRKEIACDDSAYSFELETADPLVSGRPG